MTAYVLVIRDPDSANEITTDGDVKVIDIDLGSSFDGTPNDERQALSWVRNMRGWLKDVPAGSPVFRATVEAVTYTVVDHPKAVAWVDTYVARRKAAH